MKVAPAAGDSNRILLLGFGELGTRIVSHLLAVPDAPEVWLGSRSADRAIPRRNSAVYAARQLGHTAAWAEWVETDVTDVARTAETIARIRPRYIVNATTLQSWWVTGELPPDKFTRLDKAQVGPWLPVHLALTENVVDAAILAGLGSERVVNCSFPDVVNVVLARQGRPPLTGIGNIANNEPALRHAAASALDVEYWRVRVCMIMHHYVSHRISRDGDSGGAPYDCRIYVDDVPVPDGDLDVPMLLKSLPVAHRRIGGREGQVMTAASAAQVVLGLLSSGIRRAHAPGVHGLPGGYPVTLQNGTVAVDLPEGMSPADAIAINEGAQRYEGVAAILDDGTVTFTDEASGILEEELGYVCRSLAPGESSERARELIARYRQYAGAAS